MADLQRPSVGAARTSHKDNLAVVKTEAKDIRTAAVTAHVEATSTLAQKKSDKLQEVAAATSTAIEASAESVAAKAAAVKAAQDALAAAQGELKGAQTEHKATKGQLLNAFNQAATDIHQAFALQEAQAKKDRDAVRAEQQAKVRQAKKEGRSAVVAEAKAAVAYDVYVVTNTVVRLAHGVSAVAGALTEAFKTGFNAETTVKVPESVAKRQPPAPPAGPTA